MKRLLIILLILVLLILPAMPAYASSGPPNCRAAQSYTIKTNDTLNGVAQKMNMKVDALVKYNHIYKSSTKNDHRDFFVGQKFCRPPGAPSWDGKKPNWGSWPAADFRGRIDSKNNLTITGWNFNYPASYFVKPAGMTKIKWNVKNKAFVVTFALPTKVPGSSLKFCLRNLYSDMEVCRIAS
jgi:hypothetical protein